MIPNVWIRACNGASACVETVWVTSTRCNNGSCVGVGWHKSGGSAGAGECGEAGLCRCGGSDQVWVRDSKFADFSPVLKITVPQWLSFLAAVKTGMVLTHSGALQVSARDGGWLVCHRDEPGVALTFDAGEVRAFVEGVEHGEFDLTVLASEVPSRAADAARWSAEDPQGVSEADPVPA